MKKALLIASAIALLCYSCDKDTTPTPTPIPRIIPITTLGANYLGGIVFYIDVTGQHGYVCTPTDISTGAMWQIGGMSQIFTDISVDITSLGKGQSNTTFITTHYGAGNYAAYICDTCTVNGYSDWYLPSRDELNQIYQGLYHTSHALLPTTYYSSSSEDGDNAMWELYMWVSSGTTVGTEEAGVNNKQRLDHVRAIRTF
jgi:hypothetical protein